MKCINCGCELPEGEHVCPACGQDNNLENLLREADIPQELDHLSIRQIGTRIRHLRFLAKRRYLVLLGIIAIGLVISSQLIFKHSDVKQVHNFHDDLIASVSTNAVGNSNANITNGGSLVMYGNQLYASSEGKLYCISLTLDEKRLAFIQSVRYMNIIQDTMYYINSENNTIMTADILTTKVTSTEIKAKKLEAVGNYLYYLAADDHPAIYQIKNDFSESRILTQSGCLMFNIVDDWLYYSTSDGIYRVPVMGGEVTKIVEGYYPDFEVYDHMIYYTDISGEIYRMKTDGSNSTRLVSEAVASFLVTDRYLFYARKSGGIYKQSLENDEISQLTTDNAKGLQIAGSWIYYQLAGGDEGYFVSVDEKSQDKTPIFSIKEQK